MRLKYTVVPSSRKQSIKRNYSDNMSYADTLDGHSFEYWCADLLRKSGYSKVEVTPGSGDQGVDIVAQKDGYRYAFQCKRYSNKVGNTPIQEVYAGRTFYGCDVAVVMTNSFFTDDAISLARSTGVLLWDRRVLAQMLDEIHPHGQWIVTSRSSAVMPGEERPSLRRMSTNKMRKQTLAIWGGAALFILLLILFVPHTATDKQAADSTSTSSASETPSPSPSPYVVTIDWLAYLAENDIQVLSVHSDVFAFFGAFYKDYYADTVVTIKKFTPAKDKIYAVCESQDKDGKYDFIFSFEYPEELVGLKTGDTVEIVGLIDGGSPLTVNKCHIVSYGDDAETKNVELSDGKEAQIYYAKQYVDYLKSQQQ